MHACRACHFVLLCPDMSSTPPTALPTSVDVSSSPFMCHQFLLLSHQPFLLCPWNLLAYHIPHPDMSSTSPTVLPTVKSSTLFYVSSNAPGISIPSTWYFGNLAYCAVDLCLCVIKPVLCVISSFCLSPSVDVSSSPDVSSVPPDKLSTHLLCYPPQLMWHQPFVLKMHKMLLLLLIYQYFGGLLLTPKTWKLLIAPLFLQLLKNKWYQRIPCEKIRLSALSKFVFSPKQSIFRPIFVFFTCLSRDKSYFLTPLLLIVWGARRWVFSEK